MGRGGSGAVAMGSEDGVEATGSVSYHCHIPVRRGGGFCN
jgi:hypothetical protein